MDFINYVRSKKLNGVWETYAGSPRDVTLGPTAQLFQGLLGQRYKLSKKTAAKYSDSNVWTLKECIIQVVRVKAASTGADWIVGRPVFWDDLAAEIPTVTTVAATTKLYAGQAINTISTADALNGAITLIVVDGIAPILGKASAFTKATPALGDPIVLDIGSSLATGDVLADATGWTNVQRKLEIGSVYETMTAGAVKNFVINRRNQFLVDGIM